MKLRLVSATLVLAALPCLAQDADSSRFSGYITHITSPQNFEVNGRRIQVSTDTKITLEHSLSSSAHETTRVQLSQLHPYLGQPAVVYGDVTTSQHGLEATRIILQAHAAHSVSGFGIIDARPVRSGSASFPAGQLLRADGYLILITATTKTWFDAPLTASSDITTNTWVSFQGNQSQDGIVIAEKAHFRKNEVHSTEDKLREKAEYDPTAVPAGTKQSGTSRFFRGLDVKQLPPSTDAGMQARINAIGAKLIPRYQASLPDTDATRINFRFQIIGDDKSTARWQDALTLPSGIILIPYAVVARLQNDSQVATLLADNIACALEKQDLATHKLEEKMTTAQVAADIGAIVVPGLGVATLIGNGAEATHAFHAAQDQSGRVSLWLLHDAGYDVDQAPMTWWLLSSKKSRPLADTPLPRRAAVLYQFLGESWPTEQALPTQAAPVTPQPSAPAAPQ